MGVVMIVTALAVATDADVRFQTAIADDLPGFLVNPTGSLERSQRGRASGSTTSAARPGSPPQQRRAAGARRRARLRRRHALVQQPSR